MYEKQQLIKMIRFLSAYSWNLEKIVKILIKYHLQNFVKKAILLLINVTHLKGDIICQKL